jgi:hypothetical protein
MSELVNVQTAYTAMTYMPLSGFATVDIGCECGNNTYNMLTGIESPNSEDFLDDRYGNNAES